MNGLEYTHSPPCTEHKHRSSIAIQTDSLETGWPARAPTTTATESVSVWGRRRGILVKKSPSVPATKDHIAHRSSTRAVRVPCGLCIASGGGPWSNVNWPWNGRKRRVTHWRFLPCYTCGCI